MCGRVGSCKGNVGDYLSLVTAFSFEEGNRTLAAAERCQVERYGRPSSISSRIFRGGHRRQIAFFSRCKAPPFRASSATHQVTSEQTRRILTQPLIDEVSGCTFEKTGGFFEKYFEGKPWSETSTQIYKKVKKLHASGRWNDLPEKPAQDAVWEWWNEFQTEHLCEASGVYYTAESKAKITGTQGDRQLDVLLKSRGVALEEKHHARDYGVVGELTISSKTTAWKAKFLQLATYVRDIFSLNQLDTSFTPSSSLERGWNCGSSTGLVRTAQTPSTSTASRSASFASSQDMR